MGVLLSVIPTAVTILLKLKCSLIIALFRSMHTFQRRFTITPLAIIRPEHSRTISGPWSLYTSVLPNNFFWCTQGRNCSKTGTHFTAE